MLAVIGLARGSNSEVTSAPLLKQPLPPPSFSDAFIIHPSIYLHQFIYYFTLDVFIFNEHTSRI